MKRLIILGTTAFAQIAYEYFTHDSAYEVTGFTVHRRFMDSPSLFGLPVVPFEEVTRSFPPDDHDIYVAVTYHALNRHRAAALGEAKALGYRPASYVSSHAFVWPNAALGEHCFIFENNVVQPFVRIGDNVILWSGNHIGHHSVIEANAFISSHVVVSGYVTIGANTFCGVNATIANNLTIGRDCWLGPGAIITKSVPEGTLVSAPKSETSSASTYRLFKVPRPEHATPPA